MTTKLARFLLVTFLLIAILGAVFLAIDGIVKNNLEAGAARALGTETSVADLNVGIGAGTCTVSGLEVANPEGFASAHFLLLDDGMVQVSLGSLLSERVVIPRLALSGIDLRLERRGATSNYAVILDNLKRLASGEKPETEEPGEATQYVVEEVDIERIRVHVDLLPQGGELTKTRLEIPGIRLQDVGSESNRGLFLAELCGVLLEATLEAVVKGGDGKLSEELLEDLEGGLARVRLLGELGVEVLGKVGGAAEKVGGAVEEAEQGVKKGAEEVIDGVKEVLGDEPEERDEPEESKEKKRERREGDEGRQPRS